MASTTGTGPEEQPSEEAQQLLAEAAADYAAHQQAVAQGDAVVQLGQAITSGNWAGGQR